MPPRNRQVPFVTCVFVYPTQRTFVFFIDNAILIQVPTEDKKDGEGEEGESKKASEANEESKKVENLQMINLTS